MAEAGLAPAFSVGLVVLGSVLGAALALGGGIAVEAWRIRRDDRRKALLIKFILQQEIPQINRLIDSVLPSIEKGEWFPTAPIQSIHRMLQGFDRNREWIVVIKDEGFRKAIFNYYLTMDILCRGLEEVKPEGLSSGHRDLLALMIETMNKVAETLVKHLDELK